MNLLNKLYFVWKLFFSKIFCDEDMEKMLGILLLAARVIVSRTAINNRGSKDLFSSILNRNTEKGFK